jgi:diguanylate cyclase (GGDEF)-like protein
VVLFMAPSGRDATPVQGLGAVMALAAFGPGLASLPGADPAWAMQAQVAAAALGGIVLASVAQTLVCERTERQLRESRRRLRTLANLDALTQVPNRRHFNELAALALAQDPPGSAVLLIFDVDHFKQINDHLGHAAGDRALCLVSGSVLEHLRAPDVAGRHGGDEFVLLLRRAATPDAMRVAARIVAEVQRRSTEHQLPALSLSFGLVQVGADEPIASAMRRADQALYEAKRQGRSRAVAALGDEDRPVFVESQRLGLTAF